LLGYRGCGERSVEVSFCPAGRALLFVLIQRVNRKIKAEEKIAKKTCIPLKSMKLDLLRRSSNSIDFLTLHSGFFLTHFFLGPS